MPHLTPASLGALFPLPSPAPTTAHYAGPERMPGATPEGAAELVRCLKENHMKWHCFFNEKSFHNHLTHHLFAAYALGASAALISAAYTHQAALQRPTWPSPSPITVSNWTQHLGNDNYYDSYLAFFGEQVREKGQERCLEEYAFGKGVNPVGDGGKGGEGRMLARFYAGLMHPMIQLGHGLEFGMPGMVAEGLAMMAVHKPTMAPAFPDELFEQAYGSASTGSLGDKVASALSGLQIGSTSDPQSHDQEPAGGLSQPNKPHRGTHAFTVLARVLADPSLAAGRACALSSDNKVVDTARSSSAALWAHAREWTVDGADPHDVARKLEELCWLAALLYGVAGHRAGHAFRADFDLMHLLTSALFLPSYLPALAPAGKALLLRGHLVCQLTVFVSRGRPALPIASFLKHTTPSPIPPEPSPPKPSKDTFFRTAPSPFPSPWLPILQSSLFHPEEHLPKTLRALAHFATTYGVQARRGVWEGTELAGAEGLDGELFVRVAGATMGALGWVREGETMGGWDFLGLGWERGWVEVGKT